MHNNELYHHQRKGAKWGIMNGPPYPLNRVGNALFSVRKKARETQSDVQKNAAEKKIKALKAQKKRSETLQKKKADADRREKALKSTDAKYIYDNKDVLTTGEINDRINRINTEARLKSLIVEPPKKDVSYYMNKVMSTYKKVDNAYNAINNTTLGKQLIKKLNDSVNKKEEKPFSLEDFASDLSTKSHKEIKDVAERVGNENKIKNEIQKRLHSADSDAKKVRLKKKKLGNKENQSTDEDVEELRRLLKEMKDSVS